MFNSLSDMSKLLRLIKSLEEDVRCSTCKLFYKKKWYLNEKSICQLCSLYLPIPNTSSNIFDTIFRDIEWLYLRSGESNQSDYYNEFLDNVIKWCYIWNIIPTKKDIKRIEEFRTL